MYSDEISAYAQPTHLLFGAKEDTGNTFHCTRKEQQISIISKKSVVLSLSVLRRRGSIKDKRVVNQD